MVGSVGVDRIAHMEGIVLRADLSRVDEDLIVIPDDEDIDDLDDIDEDDFDDVTDNSEGLIDDIDDLDDLVK